MPQGRLDGARAADDRESEEEGTPGQFTTLRALKNLWRERDEQYAHLPKYLTEAQISLIRQHRLSEVYELEDADIAEAVGIVLGWYPPEHGR